MKTTGAQHDDHERLRHDPNHCRGPFHWPAMLRRQLKCPSSHSSGKAPFSQRIAIGPHCGSHIWRNQSLQKRYLFLPTVSCSHIAQANL